MIKSILQVTCLKAFPECDGLNYFCRDAIITKRGQIEADELIDLKRIIDKRLG